MGRSLFRRCRDGIADIVWHPTQRRCASHVGLISDIAAAMWDFYILYMLFAVAVIA